MSIREILRARAVTTSGYTIWKPQERGDWLFGKVVEITEHPFRKESKALVIEGRCGSEYDEPSLDPVDKYVTPNNANILRLIDRVNPQPGDWLYIEYLGTRTIRGSATVKDFAMTKLTEDEVKQLFGSAKTVAAKPPSQEKPSGVDEKKYNTAKDFLIKIKDVFGEVIPKDKMQQLVDDHRVLSGTPIEELEAMGLVRIMDKSVKILVRGEQS